MSVLSATHFPRLSAENPILKCIMKIYYTNYKIYQFFVQDTVNTKNIVSPPDIELQYILQLRPNVQSIKIQLTL